ncbi:hypothetical protein TrLO_g5018 [Triparma laevis f. longispina]|uniref:Uncharacterized protein n=1 Tax=Triparma laevis f. longispina TaxID=1714387 RepID=A0A9W7B344_9STRA|nr:hypothetical protein TrLO_g5018 [Triparma laevis f. longispina]
MATYNTQNAARIKQALRSLALSLSPKQATDIIPTGDTTQRLYDDLIYNRKYGSRSLTRLPQDVLNRVQSLQQKDAETFYPSRDWDMIIQKMDGLESVVDVLLSLQRNGLNTYNANPHGTQELDPEMSDFIKAEEEAHRLEDSWLKDWDCNESDIVDSDSESTSSTLPSSAPPSSPPTPPKTKSKSTPYPTPPSLPPPSLTVTSSHAQIIDIRPGVINDDEIVRSLVLLLLQVSTSYFCPSPPPSKHAWTQTNWKSVSGLELVTGEFLIFAGNLSKVETHLSPKDSNQSLNWFVNTCKTFVDDFDSAVAVLLESADRRNLSFVQLYSAIYPFTHKVTELLNVIDESSDLNVYVATTPAGRAKSALDAALRNEVWDVWRQYSKDLKLWLETGKLPQDSSNNLFVVELDDWDYDVDVNAVPEIFEGVEWEVVKCGVQAGIYNGIMEESGGSLPPLPEIKFEENLNASALNLNTITLADNIKSYMSEIGNLSVSTFKMCMIPEIKQIHDVYFCRRENHGYNVLFVSVQKDTKFHKNTSKVSEIIGAKCDLDSSDSSPSFVETLKIILSVTQPATKIIFNNPAVLKSYQSIFSFLLSLKHAVFIIDAYRIDVSKGIKVEDERRWLIFAFKVSFTCRTFLNYVNGTLGEAETTLFSIENARDWFELAEEWQKIAEKMLRLSSSEVKYILGLVNLTNHLVTVLEDEPSSTRTFLLKEASESWDVKHELCVEVLKRGGERGGKVIAMELIGFATD